MKTVAFYTLLFAAILAQPAYAAKRGPYLYSINETREEKARRLSNSLVADKSSIENRWQLAMRKAYHDGDIEMTKWGHMHAYWSFHKQMKCDEKNHERCILTAVRLKDFNFLLHIDESLYEDGGSHKTKTLSRTVCDLDSQECWDFENTKEKRPMDLGKGGLIKGIDIMELAE